MCGADGNYLALTHRQIATIERAATNAPKLGAGGDDPPPPSITPRNRTAQMQHVPVGNPFSSSPAAAIANCCPGLEVDFRAVWRRILEGITLREYDNLVLACDIAGADLVGHRLLAINGEPTMARMVGPSPADLAERHTARQRGQSDRLVHARVVEPARPAPQGSPGRRR